MAQSDARFGYRAHLGRQDHNLSQPFGFSACPGMLLPIWFDFATPGDSYYMSHDMPLLRSIQLLAPSMVDVKVHYETFFVPLQMIYQYGENNLFSLIPTQSSFFDPTNGLNNAFPLLNYSKFVENAVIVKDELTADCFRLADLFGLAPCNFTGVIGPSDSYVDGYLKAVMPNFFPYQILTYHTIFYYYYRLDDKTQFSHRFCNWDAFYNDSSVNVYDKEFMQIHQRPWDFDYFTSIYRSPIISNFNMDQILPNGIYSNLVNAFTAGISETGVTSPNNETIRTFANTFDDALPGVITRSSSTAAIRQLFANEKLAMITGRTRKNYDSQVLAHYGISVPHDVKHDLTMIHHDTYDLNVQEVTNLASTAESPLGELAGKSYSAGNGKQFKFTAPCHGVIMTIFSIEPKKRYVTSGFDKINAITNAYDLPTPEFDRLGNVPMFRSEIGKTISQSSEQFSDIIGWKERYYQFKRKPSKVSFGYFTGNGENNYGSYFVTSIPFGKSVISSSSTMQETLPDALKPRPDLQDRFYIERGCLDNLVYQPYFAGWKNDDGRERWNYTPWLLYVRDPFIVNSYIKCKKVSWMSKDGEPIYD